MEKQSALSFSNALVDVLAIRDLCQQLYDKLDGRTRVALSHTSRGIRCQVEQCVQTFTINLPERDPNAEQIHASMNQLASCSLRPRKLDVVGGSFNYASFFAVPEYRHVWSKVEVFCDNTDSEVPLLQVLAPHMPHLQEVVLRSSHWPPPDWSATFKHLPLLHTLILQNDPSDALLTALQGVPSLRSLSVYGFSYSLIAQLTQLQGLTLVTPSVDHIELLQEPGSKVDTLSQLTGLTSLSFGEDDTGPPDSWCSQLGSALTALTQLQRLSLPHVWSGPVAEALGHMSTLTELNIEERQPSSSALVLPGVKVLRVSCVDLEFLGGLEAPQLEVLQGILDYAPRSGQPYITTMKLRVPHQLQPAELERCAQGVLRHCNYLEIILAPRATRETVDTLLQRLRRGPSGPQSDPSSQVVTSALKALGKSWCPDPSLVDGSHPLTQLRVEGDANTTPGPPGAGWGVSLIGVPVTRSGLAALPQGLTRLELRDCQLDPDTLEPLAQLSSLRQLVLGRGSVTQAQPVIHLLSFATQGCLLRIRLTEDVEQHVCSEAIGARAALKAKRGGGMVPLLEVVRRSIVHSGDTVSYTFYVSLH